MSSIALSTSPARTIKGMLTTEELARRLSAAMKDADPRVKNSDLAAACKVTPQAVSGWLKTGRLAKKHLQVISRLTGKPLEYFLADAVSAHTKNGVKPWLTEKVIDEDQFLIVFRTWQDARNTDRENLVAIAKVARKAHGTRKRRVV